MTELFCSRCGTRLVARMEGGRERQSCPGCGHIVFGHFSLGAGGMLEHEGRVLLVRRGQEPGKGRWTFPGGYTEEDESPDRAVVREVLEETGLRTRAGALLSVRHAPMKDAQNIYYVFRLTLEGPAGDLRPEGDGTEVDRAAFFAPDEIRTLGNLGLITRWVIDSGAAGFPGLPPVTDVKPLMSGLPYSWMTVFGPGGAETRTLDPRP